MTDTGCGVMLRDLNAQMDTFGVDRASSKVSTVGLVSTRDGAHGGKVVELQRTGNTWRATAYEATNAYQGDPNWFIKLFGENEAKYLGYQKKSETILEVPDGKELAGAITKINQKLAEKGNEAIGFTFLNGPDRIIQVPVEPYLEVHTTTKSLPVSKSTVTLVHDVSFHGPSIFIPNKYLNHQVDQAKVVLDFAAEVRKSLLTRSHGAPEVELALRRMFTQAGEAIDSFTANITMIYILQSVNRMGEKALHKFINERVIDKLFNGISPIQTLKVIMDTTLAKLKTTLNEQSFSDVSRIVRSHFDQFMRGLHADSPYHNAITISSEQLCQEALQKRQNIINAIKELQKAN